MKIRSVLLTMACVALFGAAPLAMAGSGSLNHFRHHALPVLVTINKHGKITKMQPAYDLSAPVSRMLRSTLEHMITGPATNKHGKGISSQAIIQLAVDATPNGDGTYEVHFDYVKAVPVPYSNYFWNHINGHRLALEDQDAVQNLRHSRRPYVYHYRRGYRHRARPLSRPTHHVQPQPVQRSMPTRRAHGGHAARREH